VEVDDEASQMTLQMLIFVLMPGNITLSQPVLFAATEGGAKALPDNLYV
jgi:cytosine/adenosine deaminase-related metal-dependent hydrolase